jgi:L-iditol 2-dehydrogenase
MKQAIMTAPKVIEFNDVPVPAIKPDEVLVKIKRIGVCGSDIHVYHGIHPYTSYPVVQGHEVAGVIEKTGKNVTRFAQGQRVTIEPQVSCGECFPCTHGLPNVCKDLKVLGFQTTGTASDFFAVTQKQLVKLPDTMDFRYGAMIEPISVGVRAVQKCGEIAGKQALVFGAGPIGNLTAQVVRAQGAREVMIADLNDFRLAKARDCGIQHTVNPSTEDLPVKVAELFGPDGPEIVLECVGMNQTIDNAVTLARQGGRIVVVGVFGKNPTIDINLLQEKELRLIGIARYVIEDFETAIRLVENSQVKLAPLITHEFDIDDYLKAYEHIDTKGGETMKVMITVNA